jgi:hypothetical protein
LETAGHPNYLGAYSIEDGKDLVLTIKAGQQEEIVGENGRKEAAMVARFHEPSKRFILNKTNAKMDSETIRIALCRGLGRPAYCPICDTQPRFGSDSVERLRIRPFVPKQGTSRAPQPSQSKPSPSRISSARIAVQSLPSTENSAQPRSPKRPVHKFGRALCWDLAQSSASAPTEEEREPESEANVATDAAVDPESEAEK